MYYGAFPGIERGVLGEPSTLWVVSRPHNWRPSSSQEWLLHLDMDSGKELGRVQVGQAGQEGGAGVAVAVGAG